MSTPFWLQPLERHLNARIAESESALALLPALESLTFGIEVHGVPLLLCLTVRDGRVHVHTDGDPPPDAAVSGSMVSMGQLAGGAGAELIREGHVRIRGDAEVAQQFQALLAAARPDMEEELSRITGDIAAHQIGRSFRAFADFGRQLFGQTAQRTGTWLQHPGGQLPAREEIERFCTDVDRVRDDVDRLQARVERLERRRRAERGE